MSTNPDVILYGGSLFLAGIQAQLERETTLSLLALGAGQADALDLIRSLRPRAVVFDLTMDQPEFAIPCLRDQPGLLLIGMDPSLDEMLIFSTRPARARAVDDLVELILEGSPAEELPSGEGAPGQAGSEAIGANPSREPAGR